MKTKLPLIICSVSMFLTACGKKPYDPLKNWRYSKADVASFIEIANTAVSKTGDRTLEFECVAGEDIYKKDVTQNDVLFYNSTALESYETNENYYTIETLKANEVNISSFSFDRENNKIHIELENENIQNYGILINKSVTKENKYALGVSKAGLSSFGKYQTEFEEEYLKAEPSWSSAKSFINVAGSIALIIAALGATPVPATSIVTGLFSYMTNFGDMFANQGPSLKDVMDKLVTIDTKLDLITEQIQKNQLELMDELVKIETQIDEVKLEQYEQNITAYNTDYIEPLETEVNVYANYVNNKLKNIANLDQNFLVFYNDKNELQYMTSTSFDPKELNKYSYKIEFNESREYLRKNNNIVGEGFGTAFMNDIKNSIKNAEKPADISLDQVAEDIYAVILDEIQYTRYTSVVSQDDIVRFTSKVTNMAKRIKGNTSESILSSYVNRLKAMYNFAGESKDVLRSILTNVKYNLDRFTIQANSACYYAGINATELGNAYEDALEAIKTTWNSIKELDDQYSYVMGIEVEGGFYHSIFDVSYTNIGNNPTFHSKLHTSRVVDFNGCNTTLESVDLNEFSYLTNNDNKRTAARYRVLKNMGLNDSKSYYEYLVKTGVIDENTNRIYEYMKDKKWFGADANRILTGWSIRDLKENDSNLYIHCVAKGGKAGSDYFNVGWKGNYRNADNDRETQYWSGKIVEGEFINSLTGEPLQKKQTIAAFAEYNESHTLWRNDEHWAFVDNPYGNYFFILNAVTK